MSTGLPAALDALRRPEYTGENRCTPCTVLNAAIAVVVAVGAGLAAPVGPTASAALGVAVLGVAGAAIALRGYLVPGTPRLTKTYFPDWLLRYFDHDGPAPAATEVDAYEVLDDAGALTECPDVDDLCLTDGFRREWWAEIDALGDADAGRAELAAMLELPAEEVELETHGDAYVALAASGGPSGRWRIGQWESAGAFRADMAGARVLDARLDRWAGLDPVARGQVLNGLRVFLDRCPSCGGDVRFGEETVQSCCRTREVAAVTCQDCGDRLFEAEQPAAA
ncbi:MAG: hypothetical protein U5J98_00075 [Halobacteriales archaeon]|nr:hypothetical protein [Halobacteriales archaeon]